MTFARLCLLPLLLAIPLSHADAPDPALLGCWRAARIVLNSPDGSTAEDSSGRCMLQFTQDAFTSTCKTAAGAAATTTYRYRVVRPQVYAATMAGSSFKTEMVGATREYEYRVDGDHLRTVTVPPPKVSVAAATASRVETQATRVECP